MAELTYREILERLEHGSLQPAYLFYGEAEFLKEEALDRSLRRLVAEEARPFNLDFFDGPAVSLESLLSLLNMPPLFAPRRAVVIREVNQLPAAVRPALLQYLASPSPTTALILLSPETKPSIFTRQLKDRAMSFHFRPPRGDQLMAWVEARARARGKTMAPRAVARLVARVGEDLGLLQSEIEKLLVWAGDEARLTEAHVDAMVGDTRGRGIFELVNAVGRKDPLAAVGMLPQFFLTGGSGVGLVSLLARQLLILGRAKALLGRRLPRAILARQLGVPLFFLGEYLEQARGLSSPELAQGLSVLLEADAALKSTSLAEQLVLERTLIELVMIWQRKSRAPALHAKPGRP